MEQLQQQILTWCHDLEDYLKCAQCNRTLVQDIYLCEAGHFVCLACSQSSPNDKCSICKMKYTKIRNYLAEDLAGKMETIKGLIGGNSENDDDWRSVCSEVSNPAWKTFSCWIGKCKTRGTIEEMRQHYKDSHSGCYVKHCDDKLPHSTSFFLHYSFPRTMDRLLDIPNVGLFILHIVVYSYGALRAHLLMYESAKNAKKYQYKLKIQCNDQNSSVEGVVDTIRIPRNVLAKNGLFLQRAHNLQLELQSTLKFTCCVELDRNNRPPEERPAQNPSSAAKCRVRTQKSNDNQTDSNANAISQDSADANSKIQKNFLKKLNTENDQNSQEKPQNPAPKKANFQKKQNAAVKSETVKKPVANQTAEVKDNQSRVNNPRQTSGGKNLPTVASIPPFTNHHQFNPMPSYTGLGIGASPGVNYSGGGLPTQGFQSIPPLLGVPPVAFPGANPYYYPAPGTPGIPGAHFGQPSAPVEDRPRERAQYPDLTKMKHKMIDDFSREAAIQTGRTTGKKLSTEKDKCLIS